MIWFSSDWHLGHINIVGHSISNWKDGYRDFDTLHEMNKTITTTINKYVDAMDTLYYLGDFAFGGHTKIPSYRDQINCQNIHFIRGNHDQHIDKYSDKFLSINDVLTIIDKPSGRPIFMSHYAHRVWLGSHKGAIHLYGHSHGSIPDYGKSMDVGIDAVHKLTGEYRPLSIEEIISIMNKRNSEFPDHHK